MTAQAGMCAIGAGADGRTDAGISERILAELNRPIAPDGQDPGGTRLPPAPSRLRASPRALRRGGSSGTT
ncbi:hypothetical protein GCM10010195_45020 [Kitasatospora griseola]|nr:hypothetical protein GCM10010195_45020 [Kitasatospora griseola]